MNKGVSVALLVVGVLLTIWDASASESFSSDVSRLFTGSTSSKVIWLLVAGIVAAIAGLSGPLLGPKGN